MLELLQRLKTAPAAVLVAWAVFSGSAHADSLKLFQLLSPSTTLSVASKNEIERIAKRNKSADYQLFSLNTETFKETAPYLDLPDGSTVTLTRQGFERYPTYSAYAASNGRDHLTLIVHGSLASGTLRTMNKVYSITRLQQEGIYLFSPIDLSSMPSDHGALPRAQPSEEMLRYEQEYQDQQKKLRESQSDATHD